MKSDKGYTGVDIAISVIVITMFIALIGTLISGFSGKSKDLQLKSEATDIAIRKIEEIKENGIENASNVVERPVDGRDGFYEKIEIEDYAQNKEDKIEGLVKKATVTIKYNYKNEQQEVELSTIISKEF